MHLDLRRLRNPPYHPHQKTKKDVQTKRKRLIRPAKLYSRKNQPLDLKALVIWRSTKKRTLRFKQSQTFSPLCWRAQSLILTTNSTKVSFQQPSYERIRRGEATGPQRRLRWEGFTPHPRIPVTTGIIATLSRESRNKPYLPLLYWLGGGSKWYPTLGSLENHHLQKCLSAKICKNRKPWLKHTLDIQTPAEDRCEWTPIHISWGSAFRGSFRTSSPGISGGSWMSRDIEPIKNWMDGRPCSFEKTQSIIEDDCFLNARDSELIIGWPLSAMWWYVSLGQNTKI